MTLTPSLMTFLVPTALVRPDVLTTAPESGEGLGPALPITPARRQEARITGDPEGPASR